MNISVLLLDDNPADSRFLSRILEKLPDWKIEIEICSDTDIASAIYDAMRPDIVFVDYRLGAMTGLEVIRNLRTHGSSAFILMTGHGDEQIAQEAIRVGAYDYLKKNEININSLGKAVRYAVNRIHMEREIEENRDRLDYMVRERTAEVNRLSEALEHSPVSVAITDKDGFIVYVNPFYLKKSNCNESDIIGTKLDVLIPGALPNEKFDDLCKQISLGSTWCGELCKTTHDDGVCWEKISLAPVKDDDDEIINYISVNEDITKEHNLNIELNNQARRLGDALNQEKEYNALHREFVSMVSHEFRTPLAIIDGAAQSMLRRGSTMPPDKVVARLDKIRKAVVRMAGLVESTLTVERIDAGQVDFNPRKCNLPNLIIEICGRFQELDKEIIINIEIEDLPSDVIGDIERLDQIFTNLISNSVKYSPGGSCITIRGSENEGFAEVIVEDTGLGVSPEDLKHLFERFFRAQSSTGITGTGIGLYLTKKLVEMHSGKISVSSELGKGTVFVIGIPINGADNDLVEARISDINKNDSDVAELLH